jgi:CobQ-like glutamine amidotransferase family enzyme
MKPVANILVLYPEHLNLNGDLANAGVLARRFNWYALDAAIDFYYPGDSLPTAQPDVVILGHGSAAAWQAIDADLERVLPALRDWIARGCFGLAINSGQELLHEQRAGVFQGELIAGERESKFAVASAEDFAEGKRVLGYKNSIFNAPLIERSGNFIGTQLHGPILAKNGWLADWIIRGVSGLPELIPGSSTVAHLERANEYETQIWKLEQELTGE